MSKCSIKNCHSPSRTKGLCNKHALRLRITGTTDPGPKAQGTLEERFWKKVSKGKKTECWEWIGNQSPAGYGRIQRGGKNSPHLNAHRVSYELHNGKIPDGYVVMHKCDNPSCVNPNHLSLGTPRQNTQDMIHKGRQVVVAPLGVENGKSILNPDLVKYIRKSVKNNAELGRELGVSINAVRGVRIGRTWSHVK